MKQLFITLLLILTSIFVSAQGKSQDSTKPKAKSKIHLGCYGIEPLYVIDGVPQTSNKFRQINPNDIVSVSVLKDAPGTEFFSNRSNNNGVVIVKTIKSLTKKEKRKFKKGRRKLKREQKKKDYTETN